MRLLRLLIKLHLISINGCSDAFCCSWATASTALYV
jgi:hypothetical protein